MTGGDGTLTDIEWLKKSLDAQHDDIGKIFAKIDKVNTAVAAIDKEMTRVKIVAGFWGFLAGVVPAIMSVTAMVIMLGRMAK